MKTRNLVRVHMITYLTAGDYAHNSVFLNNAVLLDLSTYVMMNVGACRLSALSVEVE